jgi:hypothetical protein
MKSTTRKVKKARKGNVRKKTRTQKRRKNQIQFSESDYNSGDGMMTRIWGPSLWHALHTISFNYPVKPTNDDKKQYKEFITGLQSILPCGTCRANFKKNLVSLPLTNDRLESREMFSRYIYELHELINTMLHKKSKLSYDDVRIRYENFRARCSDKKKKKTRKKVAKGKRGKTTKTEVGCIDPLHGKKNKCVLQIVSDTKKTDSFVVDKDASIVGGALPT